MNSKEDKELEEEFLLRTDGYVPFLPVPVPQVPLIDLLSNDGIDFRVFKNLCWVHKEALADARSIYYTYVRSRLRSS